MNKTNSERWGAATWYLVLALGIAAAAFERGAPPANAPVEQYSHKGRNIPTLAYAVLLRCAERGLGFTCRSLNHHICAVRHMTELFHIIEQLMEHDPGQSLSRYGVHVEASITA
jgi:hypothetical protein